MGTILSLSVFIFVLCEPYSGSDKCEKYLNDCFQKEKQTLHNQQYKEKVANVRAIQSCMVKGGYLVK